MKHQDGGIVTISRAWAGGLICMVLTLLLTQTSPAETLSLDDCVELALRNNPGLASAKYDLEGTEGSGLAASQAFLPNVSVRSGFTHSERGAGTTTIDGITFDTPWIKSEFYTLQSTVSQNLIDVPSFYRFRAARSDIAFSRETVRVSRADLVYSVRQNYYLLLKAIRLAQVAKDALAVSDEQLRKSEALYELGSVARTDVLQARVNRAAAVQEEISARNSVDQEQASLAVLLGRNVTEPIAIRLDIADPPDEQGFDEEGLIGQALGSLPEVRRARAQLLSAGRRKNAAIWDQFPSLGASLSYSKQAGQFDEVIDPGTLDKDASWGFSIGMNWTIFDGLGTIGNLKNARASRASAREVYRQAELDAALGVREAMIAINNAREGVRAAEESVALAEESLKLQQALYENGGGTILELNNAQVEQTRARNSLVEAQVGLHLAYAQLDRAIGL